MWCHISPSASLRFFFLVSKEESPSTAIDSHISTHGLSRVPPLSSPNRSFEATIFRKGSSLVCYRGSHCGASFCEEKGSCESDEYTKDFERQLLYCPGSSFPSLYPEEEQSLSTTGHGIAPYEYKHVDVEPTDALSLAKKAFLASKEAVSLAQESNLLGDEFTEPGLDSTNSTTQIPVEIEIKVRSRRLRERRLKKRGVSKPKIVKHETPTLKMVDMHRKLNGNYDPNDPLRLFLLGSNTRQLLTAKEESKLLVRIQELARLEEVKRKLQCQFGREATLAEWADAVGLNCLVLQSRLHLGNRSRERMTCANFRLVVHVAKHYQGLGINLQDLLQEGSKGLMRSIEKFKPQPGCRFSTYAYWWIRQSIRKAIFQNSRTIRLPENVHSLLKQVKIAKKEFIQEGYQPTEEELARRIGISAEKLTSVLSSTRKPLSLQRQVWADQDTTFEEITADTDGERPDDFVAKQLMRKHVQSFLNILSPKERRIIRLRFGMDDGKRKSLEQIGTIFGISKERVRQIEGHSLYKLKKCSASQGLEAYTDLLI